VRVNVGNEVLRSNLEFLKNLISRVDDRHAKEPSNVSAFVEVSTGSFLPSPEKNAQDPRWRAIQIQWVPAHANESGFFEIYEAGWEGRNIFHSGDFSNEAKKTLSETIHTINQIFAKKIPENGLEQAISSLKQIEFISPDNELFLSMFHPSMDRQLAEKKLLGSPCGTYFFRKDAFAVILEEEFSVRFAEPIRCFTLTVMLDEGKVIDHTVVERLGRYQIYDDDPLLSKPSFNSLANLLQSLFTVCKIPLRNE